MSIVDSFNTLLDVKNDIKSALVEQTESPVTVTLPYYGDVIRSIPDAVFSESRSNTLYNWMTFSDSIASNKDTYAVFNYNSKTWMGEMFINCKNMTECPEITTAPIRCDSMFEGCSSLVSVPLFDTSNCDWFVSMFEGCSSLTTVPRFNITKMYADNTGPNITSMFYNCKSLQSIDLSINNITAMGNMCYGCSSLTDLCAINCSKVTSTFNAFKGCYNLVNVGGFQYIQCDLDLGDCSLLSDDSIENIINGLRMPSTGTSATHWPTLTLHKDVVDRLTNNQIKSITDKNWYLVY